ncbi:MAG: glycosyltransferase family 2 protein [Clostridia bacterium]|nr:glycosyltransferase family 2 protein [Clostridia bacterium]
MKEPLISVIIPVYNVEKYLNRCVESILSQTYTNLEIILVDDGSTDSCPQICDEYAKKDARIKVVHKANEGLSSARNYGLDIAIGNYVSFVDSDDYVDLNYIEKLYLHIDGVDISMFNATIDSAIFDKYEAMEYLVKSLNNSASGKLYKKRCIGNVRFEEGRIHGEDYVFLAKVILQISQVRVFKCFAYHYEVRQGSITHSKFSRKSLDNIYNKKEVYIILLSSGEEFKKAVQYALRNCFMANIVVMFEMNQENVPDFIGEYNRCYEYIQETYKRIKNLLNYKQKLRYYFLRLKGKRK